MAKPELVYDDNPEKFWYFDKTLHVGETPISVEALTDVLPKEAGTGVSFAASVDQDVLLAGVFDLPTFEDSVKARKNFAELDAASSPRTLLAELNQRFLRQTLNFKGALVKIDFAQAVVSSARSGDSFCMALYEVPRPMFAKAEPSEKVLPSELNFEAVGLYGLHAVLLGTKNLMPTGWSINRGDDQTKLANTLFDGGLIELARARRNNLTDAAGVLVTFNH